jgi:hypothetical protein
MFCALGLVPFDGERMKRGPGGPLGSHDATGSALISELPES